MIFDLLKYLKTFNAVLQNKTLNRFNYKEIIISNLHK